MCVMITGVTGQVGTALVKVLEPSAVVIAASRDELDLVRPDQVPLALGRSAPTPSTGKGCSRSTNAPARLTGLEDPSKRAGHLAFIEHYPTPHIDRQIKMNRHDTCSVRCVC
jgi:hypothetical protein